MSTESSHRSPERPLQEADAQAEVFAVVRQAHQMESTEDYVELIDDLIRTQGEARLVEVAERLGIFPAQRQQDAGTPATGRLNNQ